MTWATSTSLVASLLLWCFSLLDDRSSCNRGGVVLHLEERASPNRSQIQTQACGVVLKPYLLFFFFSSFILRSQKLGTYNNVIDEEIHGLFRTPDRSTFRENHLHTPTAAALSWDSRFRRWSITNTLCGYEDSTDWFSSKLCSGAFFFFFNRLLG